ncbi:MAG: hypothetical protein ABI586_00355 [Candidatus Nanopelagicales bacterium]
MGRSITGGRALASLAITSLIILTGCGGGDTESDATPTADTGANGVEDLEASQILDEVTTAVDSATSVYVSGEGSSADQPVGVDLHLTAAGEASGTLTINGEDIQLVVADDKTYFSAGETFWTGQVGPDVAPDLVDKFVEVPAGDASFNDIATYAGFFDSLLQPEGTIEKGDETTLDGVPVIQLIDTKDDGVLSIALTGDPLPLKAETAGKGSLILTDWNEPVTIEAPASADIVDPATLAP